MIDESKLNYIRSRQVASKSDFFNFFRLTVFDYINSIIVSQNELNDEVVFGLIVHRLSLIEVNHPEQFSQKLISIGLEEKSLYLCSEALSGYKKMLYIDASNAIKKLAVHDEDTIMAIRAHYRNELQLATEGVFKDLKSITGLSEKWYYYSIFQAKEYTKHYKTLYAHMNDLNGKIKDAESKDDLLSLKNKLINTKDAISNIDMERLEQFRYDLNIYDKDIDDKDMILYRERYCDLQVKILENNNAEQSLIDGWQLKKENASQRFKILRRSESIPNSLESIPSADSNL